MISLSFVVILAFLFVALLLLNAIQFYMRHTRCDYMFALEETLMASGAGVVIFDASQRFEYSNTTARGYIQSIQGFAECDSLTDFISCLFDHALDDSDVLGSWFLSLESAGNSADFREVVQSEDGAMYLVEVRKAENGRTVVLIRDVTHFKAQSENIDALNQVNAELSLAIEAASCGVFIFDPTHEGLPILLLNRVCRDIAGVTIHDEDLYLEFSQLLEMFGEAEDLQFIIDAILASEPLQQQIKFHLNGELRWYDFRITPVFNRDGVLELYVGVLSDITALKIKEAEFYKAQKLDALGQLSAGLAHDFNNILSVVEGYARMIESNAGDAQKTVEYSGKIKESSSRAAHLIKQMMTFARHKAAQESVTDLKSLLVEQRVLLAPLFDESVRITFSCDDGDLYAYCDPDNFIQVLMNLLINAGDAMQGGGRLDVELSAVEEDQLPKFIKEQEKPYLCLKVKDNGEGIPEDVCARIFDPFFTTKEQGKGTGLGLSVVYGLVRDMGGYIDVCSEVSKGTEFSVYIPRSFEAVSKCVSGNVIDVDSIRFDGYTVLIVEDEPDLREILVEVLQGWGMCVLEAPNAEDALVLQDDYERDIDVLITDLVMPGMNGVKLAEMMVALRPDVHVVLMSGYPARGVEAKVEIPDHAIFVPKPIDFDGLCIDLYKILNQETVLKAAVFDANYERILEGDNHGASE